MRNYLSRYCRFSLLVAMVLIVMIISGCGGNSRELTLKNGSTLTYTTNVSAAEAKSIVNFFDKEPWFHKSKLELDKAGTGYIFRIALKVTAPEIEKTAPAFVEMADSLSQEVLNGEKVEVQLCDENFKTIKIVSNVQTVAAKPAEKETAPNAPENDISKASLRGKWNGMSEIPDKGKNSIAAMINTSGNEMVLDLSMAGEGTANRAKATAKVSLTDANTGTFSYQDNWKNQGSGSIKVESGKLILEIQGTTPDRKGWGIYPGKFVLNRWVD